MSIVTSYGLRHFNLIVRHQNDFSFALPFTLPDSKPLPGTVLRVATLVLTTLIVENVTRDTSESWRVVSRQEISTLLRKPSPTPKSCFSASVNHFHSQCSMTRLRFFSRQAQGHTGLDIKGIRPVRCQYCAAFRPMSIQVL